MINYLNSTKRLFVALTTTTALAGSLSLVSCQDYDAIDEEKFQAALIEKQFEATLDEYTKNFEARYGKIDPNHTWGFGLITGDPSAVTRAQVAEKNMWVDQYHMQVPGQPDIYYEKDASGKAVKVVGLYRNYEDGKTVLGSSGGAVPAGDVTDEEIEYVSWWFRTHRYPQSINVHWTDFYIQDVSADNDRDANGDVIKSNAAIEFEKIGGNWENKRYETIESQTINQLKVKTFEGNATGNANDWANNIGENDAIAGYDHIYNFNSGQSNTLFGIDHLTTKINSDGSYDWSGSDNDESRLNNNINKRLIAYYQSSGTEDWAAHYSNDEKWRDNYVDKSIWVMVHLHFIGRSGRIYDGYYLGFDYAFHKVNNPADPDKYQLRKPDGYYSNWIVKVGPGIPIVPDDPTVSFTRRIMCEDLGNTFDLDFDDIVFDVTLNLSQTQLEGYKADPSTIPSDGLDYTVTLRASGGTMPIWAGKHDSKYEAHKLFNYSTGTPVNVANGADAPIANYHIKVKGTAENPEYALDPDYVDIWVENTKDNHLYNLTEEVHKFIYEGPGSLNFNPAKKIAPQKFAVPPTVLWLKETKQIENAYTYFANWVTTPESYKTWYKNIKNPSLLCGTAAETSDNSNSNVSTAPTPGELSNTGINGTSSTCSGINQYDVIPFVNHQGWGSIEIEGGNYNKYTDGYTFAAGTTVTLKAVPATGYIFNGWISPHWQDKTTYPAAVTVDSEDPLKGTISVDGMKYVVAYFSPAGGGAGGDEYTITFDTDATVNAHITRVNDASYDGGTTSFAKDTRITVSCDLSNIPADKMFTGWIINGIYQSGNNTENFGIQGNTTITAKLVDKYDMPISIETLNADGTVDSEHQGGKISLAWQLYPDQGTSLTCYVGQVISCTPRPETGYEFVGLENGVTISSDNNITVTAEMEIVAVFKAITE